LPADSPPKPPAATDEDLARTVAVWRIVDHVLAASTTMSDADAAALDGRTVEIRASGFTSPWHGSCDETGRQKRSRVLADVTADAGVPAAGRATTARFGLGDGLIEYTFSCNGTTRTPPLTLFIAGPHAMTCFAGVCYLLAR
jgi:hypothetical protein